MKPGQQHKQIKRAMFLSRADNTYAGPVFHKMLFSFSFTMFQCDVWLSLGTKPTWKWTHACPPFDPNLHHISHLRCKLLCYMWSVQLLWYYHSWLYIAGTFKYLVCPCLMPKVTLCLDETQRAVTTCQYLRSWGWKLDSNVSITI